MRLKHKAPRKADETKGSPERVENDLLEVIGDLTAALKNTRRFLADHKLNINFEGLDRAIAKGEAALKHGD